MKKNLKRLRWLPLLYIPLLHSIFVFCVLSSHCASTHPTSLLPFPSVLPFYPSYPALCSLIAPAAAVFISSGLWLGRASLPPGVEGDIPASTPSPRHHPSPQGDCPEEFASMPTAYLCPSGLENEGENQKLQRSNWVDGF